MAGNIIPAIATTNAIIAGVIVMETMKVLMSQWEDCRSVRFKPFIAHCILLLLKSYTTVEKIIIQSLILASNAIIMIQVYLNLIIV